MLTLNSHAVDADLHGLSDVVRRWTVELATRDGHHRGSGVIWQPDGLLVTNAHVLGGALRAQVTYGDGRVGEAHLIVRDDRRDIAVLKTESSGHPSVPFGNPAVLAPGSIVLALGHPWGIAHAVSLGVVHAVTRDRRGDPRHIAADVRLAPGNSGGPLVDATGRLVGINAMIVGGLGIAIPINVVERVLQRAAAAGALPTMARWAA